MPGDGIVAEPPVTTDHAITIDAPVAHDLREPRAAVDLYWIPLGADAHMAKVSGKLFEAVSALVQRRGRCDLYHSALEVTVPEGRYVIEQTPVPDAEGELRGVVAQGSVGMRWAGRARIFRYEIRRWRNGRIPDIEEAVASPVRVTDELTTARRVLELLPSIPTPVWGRTSSTPAKCGTRTPSSHGCWRAAAPTSLSSTRRIMAERPDGAPAGSSPPATSRRE